MADIPFAVDIAQPDPLTGGSVMWHVRGATIDAFIRNLQDLRARVPAVAHLVAVSTAELREELTGEKAHRLAAAQAAAQAAIDRTAPPEPAAVDPAEKCPTHGLGKPSRYGGLMCPAKQPDGSYCKWTRKDAAAVAA